MDAERYDELAGILSEALELGPEERGPFLDRACGDDARLREEVESLLSFDERGDRLLSPSIVGNQLRSELHDYLHPPPSSHPTRIGPYRILGLLGEGGQGIVFRAEQATPRRIVALKVMRSGGLATRDDLRRFGREIQALALLRHPAIATIYEGGHTDEGQHYFAMELVEGASIDAYVGQKNPCLRERLDLFCRVCDGVDFAHRQGVIHRDLKPANILVDPEGNPKILDFGLVRIIGGDTPGVAAESRTGSIVGSLGYMSPEQIRGSKEEIGARTDVYSLGMILYELITNRRAYEAGDSLPEAVARICEEVPSPPSSVNRRLRGDLDTIALKALEKEPSRRYGSVGELADDIRRYLRGDPVRARPARLTYILGKKMRRHRLALALSTLAAVVGFAWLAHRVRSNAGQVFRARTLAVEIQYDLERKPAEQSLGAAHSLFTDHPKVPEAGLVLVQAYSRAGLEHHVLDYTRRIEARDRQLWALRLFQAGTHRAAKPELARQLEQEALAEFPDTAEAWHLRSFTPFDPVEAIRCAEAAIERDPRHVLATTRLAYLCERVADFDCATRMAQRLVELIPTRYEQSIWRRFQALMLIKQGKYREAIDRYDTLLVTDPVASWPGCVSDRALAHLCARDYERAQADYTAVIDYYAPRARAYWYHRWRATPLWIQGRLQEAAEDYEVFLQRVGGPSFVNARLFILRREWARLLDGRGASAEAETLIEEAWKGLHTARAGVEPGSWMRSILDCLAGDLEPEELIAAADRSDPEQTCEAYYYAAETCLLAGRIEDARRWFRAAVGTNLPMDTNEPADPMSEYHLAVWRAEELEGRHSESP